MYKISEFSELTGISKETLRYYAQEQLLETVCWQYCCQNFEVLAVRFRK